MVVFSTAADTVLPPPARPRLLDPDGVSVPFQMIPGTGQVLSIAFQADLPGFSERRYRLLGDSDADPAVTDLRIELAPGLIRVSNALVGIEIPTAEGTFTNGPFQRMRLRSGTWIGGGRLLCRTAIESYAARVVAAGPVFAEVECRYRFAGGKEWRVVVRVEAGEPVVLIRETCDLDDGSVWQVMASPGFSPSHTLSSVAFGSRDKAVYRLDKLNHNGDASLYLTPWPLWWNPASVAFLGLFTVPEGASVVQGSQEVVTMPKPGTSLAEDPTVGGDWNDLLEDRAPDGQDGKGSTLPGEDFLAVAAGQAGLWANPGEDGSSRHLPLFAGTNGEVFISCTLQGPGRRWLLAAQTTAENLVADNVLCAAQAMMVKHLETPLNEVLQMVLSWDSTTEFDYPRLVTPRRELAARPQVKENMDARQALIRADNPGERSRRLLYPALKIFLGSPDQPAQSVDTVHRCERIIRMATFADMLLGSDVITRAELGSALSLHAVEWGQSALTSKDVFSEADIRIARAQIAFLAYKLASPDYYSPERNFRANPNMTTTRYCAMAILACLVPDHPRAREWVQAGLDELDRELKEWTGPNGGWLESPHYQSTSISGMLLLSLAARNAGFPHLLDDARLARAMRYWARISTPPDPRYGNLRHLPPAGNTYQGETTGLFGVFAKACRPANPELADEMQWIWAQQGKPRESGIGGPFYNDALYDDGHPGSVPSWGSENFPGSGVVLRNGFPGERETYLYLLQGRFYEHYDYDRGSFELWGKGRPLCLDWGYSFKVGRMPAWQHNRVDAGQMGEILTFQADAAADYLHSHQQGWDRQMFLVKDPDPLGANYIVLRDTIAQPSANWWLWLFTDHHVQRSGDVLHVTGMHDVDLDIWLAPELGKLLNAIKPGVHLKTHKQVIVPSLEDKEPKAGEGDTFAALLKETAAEEDVLPGTWIETRTESSQCFDMSTKKQMTLTQEGLRLPVTKDEPVFCVLYPRLRGEAAASFKVLAGGRGVQITHAGGTDVVFLSATPFEFSEGDLAFKGKAGVIRSRGAVVDLALGEEGEIRMGAKTQTMKKGE